MKSRKIWSVETIIDMYKEIESEEHYDSDDISTIICDKIIVKEDMFSNEEYYRFIFDIFDICKKYVKSTQGIECQQQQ
jgi:hypothetical protein